LSFVLAIFGGSFRLLAGSCVPVALFFILAACGGSQESERTPVTLIHGPGFGFSAPPGWVTRRKGGVVEARNGQAVVSATPFTLLKPYDPSLFAKVVAELDRNAEKLAAQARGTLEEKVTTTVAGRKIRAYRYTAKGFSTRIGFVLAGRREVQLLCRAPSATPDPGGACALLFHSFTLG
jgi:hypothetical protein